MKLIENYNKIISVYYDTVLPEIENRGEVTDKTLNMWWSIIDNHLSKTFSKEWSALKSIKTKGNRNATYDIIEDYFVEPAIMYPDDYKRPSKGQQLFKKNFLKLVKDIKTKKIVARENKRMKLTKTKLKEMIREEIQKLDERFNWDYAELGRDGRLRDEDGNLLLSKNIKFKNRKEAEKYVENHNLRITIR